MQAPTPLENCKVCHPSLVEHGQDRDSNIERTVRHHDCHFVKVSSVSNGRIVLHVLQPLQRAEVEITRKRQKRVQPQNEEEEKDEGNGEQVHHENVRKGKTGKAVTRVGAHQREKKSDPTLLASWSWNATPTARYKDPRQGKPGHGQKRTGSGQDTREQHVSTLQVPVLGSAPFVCCEPSAS